MSLTVRTPTTASVNAANAFSHSTNAGNAGSPAGAGSGLGGGRGIITHITPRSSTVAAANSGAHTHSAGGNGAGDVTDAVTATATASARVACPACYPDLGSRRDPLCPRHAALRTTAVRKSLLLSNSNSSCNNSNNNNAANFSSSGAGVRENSVTSISFAALAAAEQRYTLVPRRSTVNNNSSISTASSAFNSVNANSIGVNANTALLRGLPLPLPPTPPHNSTPTITPRPSTYTGGPYTGGSCVNVSSGMVPDEYDLVLLTPECSQPHSRSQSRTHSPEPNGGAYAVNNRSAALSVVAESETPPVPSLPAPLQNSKPPSAASSHAKNHGNMNDTNTAASRQQQQQQQMQNEDFPQRTGGDLDEVYDDDGGNVSTYANASPKHGDLDHEHELEPNQSDSDEQDGDPLSALLSGDNANDNLGDNVADGGNIYARSNSRAGSIFATAPGGLTSASRTHRFSLYSNPLASASAAAAASASVISDNTDELGVKTDTADADAASLYCNNNSASTNATVGNGRPPLYPALAAAETAAFASAGGSRASVLALARARGLRRSSVAQFNNDPVTPNVNVNSNNKAANAANNLNVFDLNSFSAAAAPIPEGAPIAVSSSPQSASNAAAVVRTAQSGADAPATKPNLLTSSSALAESANTAAAVAAAAAPSSSPPLLPRAHTALPDTISAASFSRAPRWLLLAALASKVYAGHWDGLDSGSLGLLGPRSACVSAVAIRETGLSTPQSSVSTASDSAGAAAGAMVSNGNASSSSSSSPPIALIAVPSAHSPLLLELTVSKVNAIGRKLPRVLRLTHLGAANYVTGTATPAATALAVLHKVGKLAPRLVAAAVAAAAATRASPVIIDTSHSKKAGGEGEDAGADNKSDADTTHAVMRNMSVVETTQDDDDDAVNDECESTYAHSSLYRNAAPEQYNPRSQRARARVRQHYTAAHACCPSDAAACLSNAADDYSVHGTSSGSLTPFTAATGADSFPRSDSPENSFKQGFARRVAALPAPIPANNNSYSYSTGQAGAANKSGNNDNNNNNNNNKSNMSGASGRGGRATVSNAVDGRAVLTVPAANPAASLSDPGAAAAAVAAGAAATVADAAMTGGHSVTFKCKLTEVLCAQVTVGGTGVYHYSMHDNNSVNNTGRIANWGTSIGVGPLFNGAGSSGNSSPDSYNNDTVDALTSVAISLGLSTNTSASNNNNGNNSNNASGSVSSNAASADANTVTTALSLPSAPLAGAPGSFSLHYSSRDAQKYAIPAHGALPLSAPPLSVALATANAVASAATAVATAAAAHVTRTTPIQQQQQQQPPPSQASLSKAAAAAAIGLAPWTGTTVCAATGAALVPALTAAITAAVTAQNSSSTAAATAGGGNVSTCVGVSVTPLNAWALSSFLVARGSENASLAQTLDVTPTPTPPPELADSEPDAVDSNNSANKSKGKSSGGSTSHAPDNRMHSGAPSLPPPPSTVDSPPSTAVVAPWSPLCVVDVVIAINRHLAAARAVEKAARIHQFLTRAVAAANANAALAVKNSNGGAGNGFMSADNVPMSPGFSFIPNNSAMSLGAAGIVPPPALALSPSSSAAAAGSPGAGSGSGFASKSSAAAVGGMSQSVLVEAAGFLAPGANNMANSTSQSTTVAANETRQQGDSDSNNASSANYSADIAWDTAPWVSSLIPASYLASLSPATWTSLSSLSTSARAFYTAAADHLTMARANAASGSGSSSGSGSGSVTAAAAVAAIARAVAWSHRPPACSAGARGGLTTTAVGGLTFVEDTLEAEVLALARVRLCAERWAVDPNEKEARAIRKTLAQLKVREFPHFYAHSKLFCYFNCYYLFYLH